MARYSKAPKETRSPLLTEGHRWLQDNELPYEIRPDGVTVVTGNVLIRTGKTQLPFRDIGPWELVGTFDCSCDQLKSLVGAPRKVSGDFNCDYNHLTNLEGAPQSVGGDFLCFCNKLATLIGAPQSVGGSFHCFSNQLTSLTGSPQSVGGVFVCSNNHLLSLLGAPQSVGGSFACQENQLVDFSGLGACKVRGVVKANGNPLVSLDGLPPKAKLEGIPTAIIKAVNKRHRAVQVLEV